MTLLLALQCAAASAQQAAVPPATATPAAAASVAASPAPQASGEVPGVPPLEPSAASRYMRHLARELRVLLRDTPIELATQPDDALRLRIPAAWLYAADATTLRPDALLRLDALALALATPAGERTQLEITGHSDSLGARDFNAAFTRARAEALLACLAGKGVDATRMRARGAGEAQLLERSEEAPAARQRNRRVEIVVRPVRPSRRGAS